MFHYPALDIVRLHSTAMNIPVLEAPVVGDEVESLAKALWRARWLCGCRFVSVGVLRSDTQRIRFMLAAERAGVELYTPSWGRDQEAYMRELIAAGVSFILVSVQAYGLPPSLLGKVVDERLLEEILKRARRYGFNPAFEGGEAETLVVDSPLFRSRLVIKGRVVRVEPDHYVYTITRAVLVPKHST